MPGIDPALLASLGGGAGGGAPMSAVAAPGPGAPAVEPPPAEPVALHECCQTAEEAVDAAREAIEQLQQDAELANDIDPGAEKAIGEVAQMIAQIDDKMEQISNVLAGQRQEHEAEVAGLGAGAGGGHTAPAPGGAKPPPPHPAAGY